MARFGLSVLGHGFLTKGNHAVAALSKGLMVLHYRDTVFPKEARFPPASSPSCGQAQAHRRSKSPILQFGMNLGIPLQKTIGDGLQG